MIDSKERALISQAIAKAIAYKNCGKDISAQAWAIRVVYLLDCMDILDQGTLSRANPINPDV